MIPKKLWKLTNLLQPKNEACTQVNKESDADHLLDEADSIDDRSTYKKIGTQENSYVQEITKPDKILADVVKTKETSDDLFDMTKHPNCGERRCGWRNSGWFKHWC